jgi:SAM-dependent methyltransferase
VNPNCIVNTPSPWVVKYQPLIPNNGRVLDLACGTGRHAIWLAQQGYQVDAIDRNELCVAPMAGMKNIQIKIIDLETGHFPSNKEPQYDGIIVCRYLHRPLLSLLPDLLKPGGVLIYETFMVGQERYGKPSNPDYLLRPDELFVLYSPKLSIIAFEQGEKSKPPPAFMQRICVVKNT